MMRTQRWLHLTVMKTQSLKQTLFLVFFSYISKLIRRRRRRRMSNSTSATETELREWFLKIVKRF